MYLRQIRVPKPAQPTIRPFPRFVLNLVSCVKKSDANLLRPRYVASRPNIRTQWVLPTILLVLQTIKVLVVVELLRLEL